MRLPGHELLCPLPVLLSLIIQKSSNRLNYSKEIQTNEDRILCPGKDVALTIIGMIETLTQERKVLLQIKEIFSRMAPEELCINRLWEAELLKKVTPKRVNAYVRRNCTEYYLMPPGFSFRGVTILLKSPMLVGLKPRKKKILMPYTKPCYGTMLFLLPAEEGDFKYLRKELRAGIRYDPVY
jgi:hypothetical protein